MTSHWYLVKRNWPQIKAKFPLRWPGGDVWPFDFGCDGATNKELDLHSRMERARTVLDFGSHSRFVCTDLVIAEEYFSAVKKSFGEAWLLKVTLPHIGSSQISGLDIGNPTGGYSVIEQGLITEGLAGPSLNKWGLIQTLPEALAYFEARKENENLEQMDEITIVSISVLSKE